MIRKVLILLLISGTLFAQSIHYTKDEIEKMIGKMVILGFYGENISVNDKIYKDIKKYDLGGVILFDKNPTNKKKYKNIKNPEQLQKLTKQLQAINKSKLLISIDQEGGIVQRLKKSNGFISIPKASEISKKNELDAKLAYKNLSKVLSTNGINVNFAPVVDLAINPKNSVIVKLGRSYGKNSSQVIKYASIFSSEMRKQNIIGVLKHFPGHGSSLKDSHKGFVDISNTWSDRELEPYKYFIKNNKVDMIMTAHVFNKNLDFQYPATLSSNINTNILRNMLGYKGVLITDDLQMAAISKHYTLEDTVTLAINSGVDILLFANQLAKPIELETIVNTIYKQIKNNKIPIERIIESNKRINYILENRL